VDTNLRKLLEEGLDFQKRGILNEAEARYRKVLEIDPRNPDGWHLLGVVAMQVGKFDAGEQLLRRAVALHPTFGEMRRHMGECLLRMGRPTDAIGAYAEALRLSPADTIARAGLGTALLEAGRVNEAIGQFQEMLRLMPQSAEARCDLAMALAKAGRMDDAIIMMKESIAMQPELFPAHLNLGDILRRAGRIDDALVPAKEAARLRPDISAAHTGLANIYQMLGEFDDAVAEYGEALKIDPKNPDALNNLGLTLLRLCRIDEAVAAFDKAMSLRQNFIDARANRALGYLLRGDLEMGWVEYEWRWKSGGFTTKPMGYTQPQWDGSDLAGKTIVMHSEQGLGDTIQFARYATVLRDKGAKVILQCSPTLTDLLKTIDGVSEVVPNTAPTKLPFDVHIPMATLPLVLKTRLDNIPNKVPYISADPVRVAQWKEKLDAAGGNTLKVGIAWAGSPLHLNDRARTSGLGEFAPLAEIQDVTFFSMQKGDRSKDAKNPPAGMKLVDLTGDINDFQDTAAMVDNLDLVIAVDTSVVHLAGALGKPVWVMMAYGPDWRWLLDREDSPWYPTMTILRQPRAKAWKEAFEKARGMLAEVAAGRK
jgi:tetratricopeptide (TPR) repeat protein